jgi:hypothetical protein
MMKRQGLVLLIVEGEGNNITKKIKEESTL